MDMRLQHHLGINILVPGDILDGATEWTIMGRIYANTLTGNESPFIGGMSPSNYPAIRWRLATGKLQLRLVRKGDLSNSRSRFALTIVTGVWYHVAIRYDGTNASILINGVDDITARKKLQSYLEQS